MRIGTEVHACARLLGGPSDGFMGRTIGLTVGQYKAQVIFDESAYLRLLLHPQYDPTEFQNIAELAAVYGDQGYSGGMQLLQATVKYFYETGIAREIPVNGPNFTVSYDMNIPRYVGFSERGALVIAALRNLLQWYGVGDRFAQPDIVSLAYEIESEELHRTISLQNRVVQTYGGALYMDFAREFMNARGFGNYQHIEVDRLPPLFLAHLSAHVPSRSVRSNILQRWNEGEPEVRTAMTMLAQIAEEGARAIAAEDYGLISELVERDQQVQRKLYGDPVLGPDILRMLEIAKNHDLPATISSLGIMIGILGDEPQNAAFADHLKAEGYHYLRIAVGPAYPWE